MAGERVEVVFHGDTTGSMSPCFRTVQRRFEDALTRLFKEIPNLRIGISANGDYCDVGSTYAFKRYDLTRDIHGLCQFVRNIERTNGGDLPECYELVLREAQSFDWTLGAKKILVFTADDVPHPTHDLQNRINNGGTGLDWREEANALSRMGVVVYAVQCLSKRSATAFYRELAERTGGYHLELDQFDEVVDLLMAACYQQTSPEAFAQWEGEVAASGRMSRSVDLNFARISGRHSALRFAPHPRGLDVVPFGRFQILRVDRDASIRGFVEDNGLEFKKGRGFYEFTKTELIQEKKEVVLRDKVTGDIFSGAKAREMIGLPFGERAKVKPVYLEKFTVFVQSTSYNRVLKAGTRFLYEVDLSR